MFVHGGFFLFATIVQSKQGLNDALQTLEIANESDCS